MAVDAAQFRAALAQWPTGVTIVTVLVDGRPHGMTASSFSSVSLDPPLVSVCLARSIVSHDHVSASGSFAVSILAKDQAHLGRRFSTRDPELDRFAGATWETAKTGAPVLADALAWLDCAVAHEYAGGDHTIFIGEVLAAATPRVTSPLLYHSRTWGQFADVLPDQVVLTDPARLAAPDLAVHAGDEADVSAVAERLRRSADASPRVCLLDAFDVAPEVLGRVVAELAALGPAELVLVEDGRVGPVQVREGCREAVLRARPVPVAVRLSDAHGLVQGNLLTALKSGVVRVDVGAGATPREHVLRLAAGLGLEVVERSGSA